MLPRGVMTIPQKGLLEEAAYRIYRIQFVPNDSWCFPGGSDDKESGCQCRRCKICGLNLWSRKIPWRRKWQPLQYSCLENPTDRGGWRTTVHGVPKSQTRLSDWARTPMIPLRDSENGSWFWTQYFLEAEGIQILCTINILSRENEYLGGLGLSLVKKGRQQHPC